MVKSKLKSLRKDKEINDDEKISAYSSHTVTESEKQIYDRLTIRILSEKYSNEVLENPNKYWGYYAYITEKGNLKFKTVKHSEVYKPCSTRAFLRLNTE